MERIEQTYKLPEGWILTSINELVHYQKGKKPKKIDNKSFEGSVPYLDIKAFEHKNIERYADSESAIIVEENDIVMVWDGARSGWVAEGTKGALGSTLAILKPFITNPKYLYYYLTSKFLFINSNAKGTGIPHVDPVILWGLQISLPPLQEQQKIVSKIELIISELDHAERVLQKARQQLDIYKQSLLKSAFNGSITSRWRVENEEESAYEELETIKQNRKKKYNLEIQQGNKKDIKADYNISFQKDKVIPTWANAYLDNLIDINARIGWKGLTKKEYTTEGPLLLSVHSLNFGKNVVYKDANHITYARYEESPEIKLKTNDILLCKDGAGIGKVGIIKSLPDKATVNSSLLVINAMEVFNPDFLYYFFSGPTMQKLVNDKISGSAIPHLFQNDIKKFNLKVPPKEEQNEIVYVLESRFTLVENLEKSIYDSLGKVIIFKHSILNKAFEGKLVEQNPNDESALELLQKIKIEKDKYLQSKNIHEKLKPKKKRLMETKKTVLELLEEAEYPLSPQALWQKSIHEGDIESFYSEIKDIYSKLEEINKETEPLLILKK